MVYAFMSISLSPQGVLDGDLADEALLMEKWEAFANRMLITVTGILNCANAGNPLSYCDAHVIIIINLAAVEISF